MTNGADILTHSRMACARTCLRKHWLAYVLGIKPVSVARPLYLGKAIHLGRDELAKGKDIEQAVETVLLERKASEPVGDEELHAKWEVDNEIIANLLRGYAWRWSEMPMKFIESEFVFKMPIVNPATGRKSRTFTASGIIDGIVDLDGRLAVNELKTCSEDLSSDSMYWRRLRIDQQISLYFLGARHAGFDVETILYDVIRKPTIAPKNVPILDDDGLKIVLDVDGNRSFKKDGTPRQSGSKDKFFVQSRTETPQEYGRRLLDDPKDGKGISQQPDFYFARKEIPRLESDLEEFCWELWDTAKLLADCQRHNRWPRNTGACVMFGQCPYLDLCLHGWKDGDELPEKYHVVENIHQELEEKNHGNHSNTT